MMRAASPNGTITSSRPDQSKPDFVHYFNAKNARNIAFCIVCGFVLYHSILRLSHGIDSCQWLLTDGNFRDQVWQPYGCMMHRYTQTDARRCMRYMEYWGGKNYFVFIGDSKVEQIFHEFLHQISPTYDGPSAVTESKQSSKVRSSANPAISSAIYTTRTNIAYNDSHLGLRAQYFWVPFPNKTLVDILEKLQQHEQDLPSVVVISLGSWIVRSLNPSDPKFADAISEHLAQPVTKAEKLATKGAQVLWAMQEPVDEDMLGDDWSLLTNSVIDLVNDNVRQALRYLKVNVWYSSRRVATENLQESPDGFHLSHKTVYHDSQILLNMYCNDNMNYNDATCCSSSEPVSGLQIIVFAVLIVSCALSVILLVRTKWLLSWKHNWSFKYAPLSTSSRYQFDSYHCPPELQKSYISALGKIALIMAYFFICDRTTMFMKENKYFTQTNFWLPVVYILVLGLFFTEDSTSTKVLHYDQENETKGWMVLLILVYNMMGASQVVPIFMFVKVLYSGFLFLHGYNQFLTYLHRADKGIVKLLRDLFRLNFMAVMLCLCMNRPYQFYDFIPLVSFWTFVVYVGLCAPPRITWSSCETNSLNYLYLVFRIVGILLFVTILYMSEVFFEKVFVTRPWKALFVTTDDDIREWWTRWKIDRYSMPCGMVLAFGYHLAKRNKILEDDNNGNLFSTRISISVMLFSLLGIGGYCVFSVLCRSQLDCIEIHSYVGFIPVASYLILRNVSGILRTRFSSFFSWFGQFWVELLVGQYHVWMGADGHGVLVLVPAYPVGNVLLTAFVFVCIAQEIRKCTDILLPYAVPEDWRKAIRNTLVFLLILVPIGIHDGMF